MNKKINKTEQAIMQISEILNDIHDHEKLDNIEKAIKSLNQSEPNSTIDNAINELDGELDKIKGSRDKDFQIQMVNEPDAPVLIFSITSNNNDRFFSALSFTKKAWDSEADFVSILNIMKRAWRHYKQLSENDTATLSK